MSCNEKRFSDMIYSYELGLLSDDDRREFEIHIIECDSCFEELSAFKQEAFLLKNDPEVQDSVREFLVEKDIDTKKHQTKITSINFKTIIPIAAAIAIFLILILKDWQFEISPSKEAIASENRIAIMYFEDLTDSTDNLKLGEITANLLMTDLAESEYLNVISSQRLYDLLKLIGQEGVKSITKETASKIAFESKADWIVMGSILQTDPNIIITTQLIEAKTGDISASQKLIGKPGEEIFSVVDQLTKKTKENLNLPADALAESDLPVAEFTTNSSDAYRNYLNGIENINRLYNADAISDFETAIQYDSTFAMAYYYLAKIKDRQLIHKAIEYSNNVSNLDKLYIDILKASYNGNTDQQKVLLHNLIRQYPDEKEGHYQLSALEYALGNYKSSVVSLLNTIEIDPNLKVAYNQLAYAYNNVGDFEKALWATDKYIALASDEANPYDTKAEIYALNGMLDNAIDSYKRALEIKPDFLNSRKNLALMYIFKQQYDLADSCLSILQQTDSQYAESMRLKALIPLFRGELYEALGKFDIAIDSSDKDYAINHYYKSRIYIEQKNWEQALFETDKATDLYRANTPNKAMYRYLGIQTLAEKGDLVKAEEQLAELKTYVEQSNNMHYTYWYSAGSIEIAECNYDKACECFEKSKEHNDEFVVKYMLARAYAFAGRYTDAINEFEKIQNEFGVQRSYFGIMSVKLHYYLGAAYEETGQYEKAIEQYGVFLDIWKNADDGIEEIVDAKGRLAKLKSGA